MDRNYFYAYQSFVEYHRESFGSTAPLPTFNEWLYQNGLNYYQPTPQPTHSPGYSSLSSPPLPPQHHSSTSVGSSSSLSSPQSSSSGNPEEGSSSSGNKNNIKLKKKRERWTDKQTRTLIESWKKHFNDLESAKQATAWQKIRLAVNTSGSEKTMKQVKDKFRNLKDGYKSARDHNKKSGVSPMYSPFYDEFDEILGTRDVINTPLATEVGAADDGNEKEGEEREKDDDKEKDEQEEEKEAEERVEINEGGNVNEDQNTEADTAIGDIALDQDFKELAKEASGKRKKGKNAAKTSFQEQIINLQREQMQQQSIQDASHQQLILDIFEQQRKADAEEREKDRQFFLQLGSLLGGNNAGNNTGNNEH